MSIICAIHQPNFFPWLGYFDKIKNADIFVFLDDVQNIKTGGSWVNRVKLNCRGTDKWYTCPIKKQSGVIPINQVEFSQHDWKNIFFNILYDYYSKYPNFKDSYLYIQEILNSYSGNRLADLNRLVIERFSETMGYTTKFILKSDLNVSTTSTAMLVDICKAVNADTYLCGGGASGYQDDSLFEYSGISLRYQNYSPVSYGDGNSFIPGLSVIDYFMSVRYA